MPARSSRRHQRCVSIQWYGCKTGRLIVLGIGRTTGEEEDTEGPCEEENHIHPPFRQRDDDRRQEEDEPEPDLVDGHGVKAETEGGCCGVENCYGNVDGSLGDGVSGTLAQCLESDTVGASKQRTIADAGGFPRRRDLALTIILLLNECPKIDKFIDRS